MKKLKVINGKVQYLFNSGKDLVRNSMDEDAANRVIESGNSTESNKHKGYGICVDDLYYFETINVTEKKTKSKGDK